MVNRGVQALLLAAAVAVLVAGAVNWPRLFGFVDFVFLVVSPLVLVLGYRFDDGSPRHAEYVAMRPIRRCSVALIVAVVVSWTDVRWCFGALAAIAIIQLFQHPRRQPLALVAAAVLALLGTASDSWPLELRPPHHDAREWVPMLLACTTGALLLVAALAQHFTAQALRAPSRSGDSPRRSPCPDPPPRPPSR